MGHQHQRRALLVLQPEHQIDDGGPGVFVEIAGRLIRDENRWFGSQGAGQCHTLLLAAGQLRRVMAEPLAKPHTFQLLAGAAEWIGHPGQFKRHGDILDRSHCGDEMEGLEHDADPPPAKGGQPVFIQRGKVLPINHDTPRIRALKTSQRHQQGRFAGTGWTDQANRFATRDIQRNTFKDMHARRIPSQGKMHLIEQDGGPIWFAWHIEHKRTCRRTDKMAVLGNTSGRAGPIKRKGAGTVLALLIGVITTLLPVAGSVSAFAADPLRIVVLGDSLSAGYNLPADAAYPVQLEAALKAKGLEVTVENAGVSGDTTSGGLDRLDWSVADGAKGVIVALGANDALRGIDPAIPAANLDQILSRLKARNIPVFLVGMLAPPNNGADYAAKFNAIYPDLSAKYALPLYPFFLDGVMAVPGKQLPDGMHPTREGVAVMVERTLPQIETWLSGLK
jgi:acyl-CoA thioesterase I